MGSFRQIYYQIIFTTKFRRHTISEIHCKELYKYISGIIANKNCKLLQINGVEDHIHIFCDLHPSISLANFVKDIKIASSIWMKECGFFPKFESWSEGYSAFTYNYRDRDMIINYVKKQKQHHKKESPKDQLRRLLQENKVEFKEQYLE